MKKITTIVLLMLTLFMLGACADTTAEIETTEQDTHAEADISESVTKKITGTIYGVFSSDDSQTLMTEFSCKGGIVTPERIAAGLSGWTGLKFRITSETDEENKVITVNWTAESSLATGSMPNPQRKEFRFENADQVQIFMLNSLCRSIQENIGEYDVYFKVDGKDIDTLGIADLTSEKPFNKTESDIVFVK